MSNKSQIHGYKGGIYKRFSDKIGALSKSTKLKRMEPYADIIEDVLSKYNKDDDQRTMMVKLIRHPEYGTTNRKKHTENVREIAGKIADEFKWLNPNITRIMGKEHDTGHTFLGHSGEWWISSINSTYGLPNYVHNAIGTRKLLKANVYDEIENDIKKQYPNISVRKLKKIKRDLWLILDGINCHNGEKSEYSYSPDFSKDKKRFEDELMGCFVNKGFDRTLIPATAEGSLMRLCDKISYIPLDLVDIFRNHCNIESIDFYGEKINFYDEYRKKFEEMGMPKNSLERLLDCKTEKEYDDFAHEMQEIFIKDVIANTKRNNIRMSPEMSKVMHGFRDINNRLLVNYTVMKEDHDAYVPAIENLMNIFATLIVDNRIVSKYDINDSLINTFAPDKAFAKKFVNAFYQNPLYRGLAKFVTEISPEDFKFTVDSVKKSFEKVIDAEMNVAEDVVLGNLSMDNIKAVGNKAERINTYLNLFRKSLDVGYSENIFKDTNKDPLNNYKKKVWLNKTKDKIKNDILSFDSKTSNKYEGITPLHVMIAMDIGAQYLASLNDNQFFDLIQEFQLITPEQAKSLQRKYSTFDFRKEYQRHSDWDNLERLQKMESEEISKSEKVHKRNFFERFFGR